MHEYSVTRSLIELCNAEAEKNNLTRINKINIRLGKFTGFSADSIRFYFGYLKQGTRCAEADLFFNEVAISISCQKCKYQGSIAEPIFFCPECGSQTIDILSGREFYVESIEGE